jgi:hypothetical protein
MGRSVRRTRRVRCQELVTACAIVAVLSARVAGLRRSVPSENMFLESDLLVVPAKRRRSPRPATPNVPPLRSDTHTPLPASTPDRYGRYSRLHRSDNLKESFVLGF